jgi:hypothetical protein
MYDFEIAKIQFKLEDMIQGKKEFFVDSSDHVPWKIEWYVSFPWEENRCYVMLEYSKSRQAFRVYTGAKISPYLEHITADKEEALNKFEEYLGYAMKKEVPEEALPAEYFSDKIVLDSIGSRLEEIAEQEGLEFSGPNYQEGHPGKNWLWKFDVQYKNEPVFLFFEIDLSRDRYRAVPGVNADSQSEWFELKGHYTKDLEDALIATEKFIGFSKQNQIPKEHLPVLNEWEDKTLKTPIGKNTNPMFKSTPIFQVIKEYVYRKGRGKHKEHITVKRNFHQCQESTSVAYKNHRLEETVHIEDGKITQVVSHRFNELPKIDRKDTEEVFFEKLRIIFQERYTPIHGNPFTNIKRFEKQLKELKEPEWQKDLQAIYDSDGINHGFPYGLRQNNPLPDQE